LIYIHEILLAKMPVQETVIVLALAPWTEHVTILVGVVLPKVQRQALLLVVANFANIN